MGGYEKQRKKADLIFDEFHRCYCLECKARSLRRRIECNPAKCILDYVIKNNLLNGGNGIDSEWVQKNITVKRYKEEHDRIVLNYDEKEIISWVRRTVMKKIG